MEYGEKRKKEYVNYEIRIAVVLQPRSILLQVRIKVRKIGVLVAKVERKRIKRGKERVPEDF